MLEDLPTNLHDESDSGQMIYEKLLTLGGIPIDFQDYHRRNLLVY